MTDPGTVRAGWPEPLVEAVARRVAELVSHEVAQPLGMIDTATVAHFLSVSEGWVRDHAAELGAIRLGDGPKGTLRFDVRRVRAALELRRLNQPRGLPPRPHGPRQRSLGVLPAGVPEDVRDW